MRIPDDVRRMARLMAPERWPYALGLLALAVVNVADVAGPLFIGAAVDLVAAGLGTPGPGPGPGGADGAPTAGAARGVTGWLASHLTLGAAIGGYLALQLVANLCRYPMVMLTSIPSHRVGQVMRNRLTGHLLRLSRPFYDRARSGDLMSLATADVQAVRMFFGPGILLLVDTALLLALVLAVMVGLSWSLTLAALLPLPLIAVFTQRFSLAEFARFGKVQEDIARLTERARETYAGIRVLQGYAREDSYRTRFAEHSRRHLHLNLRLARVRALFDPSLDLLLGLSTVLVLAVGGAQLARGTLSLGSFVAFLYLVGNLSGPMIGFGWAVSLFQRGRASLQRLMALWAEPVEIADAPGAREHAGPGHVAVRDLTFAYPGAARPALDGVGFELAPGRTLGVIGPVGSGKSTLAALLARLYDPPPGSILLDGTDVRGLTLASLRRAVVVAPQDTFLFGDTVERNILLTAEAEGRDPLELARLARIDDEIRGLPQGAATLLGERGVNLSGGQRQRLAIARAIGADPRVLVLDDCLSAVDARTEGQILANLREVFAGRAGVVISHRVRAVAPCDEILVLEGGRVTARGTHERLLATSPYYAGIAREQAAAGDEP